MVNLRRWLELALWVLASSSAAHAQAKITGISPAQGPIAGGTTVTLTGSGFTGTTLLLDYTPVTPTTASDTQIQFKTPVHDNGIAIVELSGNGPNAYAEFLFIPPTLQSLPPGYITTVMGMGVFEGDGRKATNAMLTTGAAELKAGADGSVYILEPNEQTIRRIRSDGVIEGYAGTKNQEAWGDGGPAIFAALAHPTGLEIDAQGNVLLSDANAIRKIDANTGIINSIAGSQIAGFSGDGGPAKNALFNQPQYLAFDGTGNLYILDFGNVRIRKIDTNGIVTTIAGTGVSGYSGDGGPATQATINNPNLDAGDLAADKQGNVFLSDWQNGRIRRIDANTGIITTFLNANGMVTTDGTGNLYVGIFASSDDSTSRRVLKLSPTGQLLQSWGKGYGFSSDGVAANNAPLGWISRITLDNAGNILFTEYDSNRIRRITPATGILDSIAGIGPQIIGEAGPAVETVTNDPGTDIAFLPNGEFLTAEASNYIVRKVDHQGTASVFAGSGYYSVYPTPPQAPALQSFLYPSGITVAPNGTVFIVNNDGANIVRVDALGNLYPVTSNSSGFSGDGGPASFASLASPSQATTDSAGNLFVADTANNRIRRIDALTSIITTVAGNGTQAYCGDGGPAPMACLDTPSGVVVDTDGSLYIGENQRVRKVSGDGTISTLVTGFGGYMALNSARNVFTHTCRIEPAGHVFCFPFQGGETGGLGDGGPVGQSKGGSSGLITGIAIDDLGDFFFSDYHRIRAIRFGAVISEPGSSVAMAAGTSQTAFVGNSFSVPLLVTLKSPAGTLENGIRVDFSSPASGASCTFPNGSTNYSVLTDISGHATATCTAAFQAGAYSVTATPLALGQSVTFALANAVQPQVQLSGSSLDFNNQLLNLRSVARRVSLTNSGSAVLQITNLSISGDFEQSNSCPAMLAVSATCAITIVFHPRGLGAENGALTITDNAPGSPHTVSLSGTGFDIVLNVSRPTRPRRTGNIGSAQRELTVELGTVGGSAQEPPQLSCVTAGCVAKQRGNSGLWDVTVAVQHRAARLWRSTGEVILRATVGGESRDIRVAIN